MTAPIAVAVAGLTITLIVGFSKLVRALGRLEQQQDLLWRWYLGHHPDALKGGRRYYDPPDTSPE